MIQYRFPGKIALVTGSSRGLGAATLEAFAKAGATCIVHFFDDPAGENRRDAEQTAQRLRQFQVPVHILDADVRDAPSVEFMMRRIVGTIGGLDILVNNAGICRDRTLKRMSLDEWQSVVRTNLDGVFHCLKYGAEILRENGRIVNIASISGVVGFPGQANYAAAKAGVIALTKVASKELARRGITVNALAPGLVRTAMLDVIRADVVADYEKQIPVGRVATPEDIAHVVLFLASEETSYITGHTVHVTGGWH